MSNFGESKWLPENMKNGYFLLNAKNVSLVSGMFAILLLPVGIFTYINNTTLTEVQLDYTRCKLDATSTLLPPSTPSSIKRWKYDIETKTCTLEFDVTEQLERVVHLYVRITNMNQNSRLYMNSQSISQLQGVYHEKASDISNSVTTCSYLQYANCDTAKSKIWVGNGLSHADNNPDCLTPAENRSLVIKNASPEAQYYPCGLIANSFFSDEIGNLTCSTPSTCSDFNFSEYGIAWPEDASQYDTSKWKTTNPAGIPTSLIPPPQWRAAWPKKYGAGYNSSNLPPLKQMERFQVWMRKAGLPQFRKLWGKSNANLQVGTYSINITDNWDCLRFNGTKAVVFSEVGAMGSKNPFLGYMLLIVGLFCILTAILVLVVRVRQLGDPLLFSWNKEKVE